MGRTDEFATGHGGAGGGAMHGPPLPQQLGYMGINTPLSNRASYITERPAGNDKTGKWRAGANVDVSSYPGPIAPISTIMHPAEYAKMSPSTKAAYHRKQVVAKYGEGRK